MSPEEFERVLEGARARFEQSRDFTIGIEEEYALLDPETLDLVPEFHRAEAAAQRAGIGDAVAGELLASEIEFLIRPCATWQEARDELTTLRGAVAKAIDDAGLLAAASGTHPWADYREQQTIDAPYYEELVRRMQYVARRNNTFGLHVHVGVRGADRAVRIATALRDHQHLLLALSASSPFLDGRDSGLASARSITFSRLFPRANVAPGFRSLDEYLDYLRLLYATGTIITPNQVWWGARPHVRHGTVELRMFDGQPDVRDSLALAALGLGVVAHLVEMHDAGELPDAQPAHLVDENLWRAMRWGTDAMFIDLPTTRLVSGADAVQSLVEDARAAGRRAGLDIDAGLDRVLHIIGRGSSAAVQRRAASAAGGDLRTAYADVVATTMSAAAFVS